MLTRERVKGRRTKQPFLMLYRRVIGGPEWTYLSAHAVKLLIDLGAQYYGCNNGDLCATWTVMSLRGWRSRQTLHKALKELIAGGWIELTRQGGRNRASLYALSWLAIDECGGKLDVKATRYPTDSWRKPGLVPRPASSSTRKRGQSSAAKARRSDDCPPGRVN